MQIINENALNNSTHTKKTKATIECSVTSAEWNI